MIFKNESYVIMVIIIGALCDITANKKFNSKGLPTIIWWTDMLYPHYGNSSEIKCSLGNCMTSRRKKYKNNNITIAYLFYGTDFHGDNLPLPRQDNHIWALLHEESPMNNYIFSHSPGIELFNYTSTFSRESNFPLTTQYIPSIEYLIERKPLSIDIKNEHRRSGTASVLYLQSHCNVASDRDRYVKKLMDFIDIDSYGTCLHNKDLPLNLATTETYNDEELFLFISKYKFHLAFENAICDDYITEKLFRVFHVGSVPIYKGSSSVQDWAPSDGSIILVDDFQDPSQLAEFIMKLDQNDELYEQFLKYKYEGISNDFLVENLLDRTWGMNDPNKMDFISSFECYICDKIHESNKLSVPSAVNRKHMNCDQPRMSLLSEENIYDEDEWLQENWTETYLFAYDEASAIERMIKNKEHNTSRFTEYIESPKYRSNLNFVFKDEL